MQINNFYCHIIYINITFLDKQLLINKKFIQSIYDSYNYVSFVTIKYSLN